MDIERELERMISTTELPKQNKELEAVKRLPTRWVAVARSEFNQVSEETKRLRRYVPKEKKHKYET